MVDSTSYPSGSSEGSKAPWWAGQERDPNNQLPFQYIHPPRQYSVGGLSSSSSSGSPQGAQSAFSHPSPSEESVVPAATGFTQNTREHQASSTTDDPVDLQRLHISRFSTNSRLAETEMALSLSYQLTEDSFVVLPRPSSEFVWKDLLVEFESCGRRSDLMGKYGNILIASHIAIGAKFSPNIAIVGDVPGWGQDVRLGGDLTAFGIGRHHFCGLLVDWTMRLARESDLFTTTSPSAESITVLCMLESLMSIYGPIFADSRNLMQIAANQILTLFRNPKTDRRTMAFLTARGGLAFWVYTRDINTASGTGQVPLLGQGELKELLRDSDIPFEHFVSGGETLLKHNPRESLDKNGIEIIQTNTRSIERTLLFGMLAPVAWDQTVQFVRGFWRRQDELRKWIDTHHSYMKPDPREPNIGPSNVKPDRLLSETITHTKLSFLCHRLLEERALHVAEDPEATGIWRESNNRVSRHLQQIATTIKDVCEAEYKVLSSRLMVLRQACNCLRYLPGGISFLINYLQDEALTVRQTTKIGVVRNILGGFRSSAWAWCDNLEEVSALEVFVDRLERGNDISSMPEAIMWQHTPDPLTRPPVPSTSAVPTSSIPFRPPSISTPVNFGAHVHLPPSDTPTIPFANSGSFFSNSDWQFVRQPTLAIPHQSNPLTRGSSGGAMAESSGNYFPELAPATLSGPTLVEQEFATRVPSLTYPIQWPAQPTSLPPASQFAAGYGYSQGESMGIPQQVTSSGTGYDYGSRWYPR